MDVLTLELFDVTVSQALTEVSRALEQHPDLPLRVLLDGEEMILHNLLRFLERQDRKAVSTPTGTSWQLDIPPLPVAHPALQPLPAPVLPASAPRPLLLMRSAFAPGDRALGRQLLLGLLGAVEPPVPWVGLAHEALGLLEDPMAVAVLEGVKARGVPVRLSKASLAYERKTAGGFELLEDEEWQALAAQGKVTLL